MISIAAAGPHNGLFATLQTGQLARSAGLGELWGTPLPGRATAGLAVSARGDDSRPDRRSAPRPTDRAGCGSALRAERR